MSVLCGRYGSDGRVTERWCRCVRFGVRCSGRRCTALAAPLCAVLRAHYAARAHSGALYLAAVLLDELHATPPAVPPLVALLRDVLPRALHKLQQPRGLVDHPDTVDDLFRLCIRCVLCETVYRFIQICDVCFRVYTLSVHDLYSRTKKFTGCKKSTTESERG